MPGLLRLTSIAPPPLPTNRPATPPRGRPASPPQHRPRPGKFEGVAPEEAEALQRELAAVAAPEWLALLFHKDFKRHLDAAEQARRGRHVTAGGAGGAAPRQRPCRCSLPATPPT